MSAVKKLSWKAIHRGAVYCAPACGRGCTWSEYQKALAVGRATANRLGDGWRFEVFENLGWHTTVISPCGRIKVAPFMNVYGKVDSYTAFLGKKGEPGGNWAEHSRTPKGAVAAVIAVAKRDLDGIGAILKGL